MNAIVPVTNADAYRASTDAAGICKQLVLQTATTIQGRKYVKVEGWQAIAVAHGCTASARDVERVDGGIRAIGEIRRMSDGVVIAEAEGFVGEDEPTWFGGKMDSKVLVKRPDYAIRAMAQTRAISRACRSAFAHVVVMMNAGLSTTPAEEAPYGGFDEEPHNITPEPQKDAPTGRLKPAEAKRRGIDADIKIEINALDLAGLVEWGETFEKRTETLPLGWLDSVRDMLESRRLELMEGAADYAEPLDEAFRETMRVS